MTSRYVFAAMLAGALALGAGCGGSSTSAAPPSATSPGATTSVGSTTSPGPSTTARSTAAPGALQAEAKSAAAGDIPDNQVFLTFRNANAGYSMKYPEGWAQQGSGRQVTFRDKNNIARIVVVPGGAPTEGRVRADLAALMGAKVESPPQGMTIAGKPAFKVTYSTESAPNPVTGKRVTLAVDRYYLWKDGRTAIVDLGTPVGVDNVDAYRLMIESFRWS